MVQDAEAAAVESVIGVADTYRELVEGLIARRHELGLSQNAVDDIAGLAAAYTSKIECGTKRMGSMSLEALLSALALQLRSRLTSESMGDHDSEGHGWLGP